MENSMEPIDGALLADGFEAALVGFGYQFNYPIAVYNRDKCIEILMDRDGMTREEAIEYYEFNIIGGYFGESNPCYLDLKSYKEILGDN